MDNRPGTQILLARLLEWMTLFGIGAAGTACLMTPGCRDAVGRTMVSTVSAIGDALGSLGSAMSHSRDKDTGATCNPAADDEKNQRCAKAKQDAQSRYWKLTTKRIPQYLSGGTNGADAEHYNSILQMQAGLKDAIRRVKLYCNPPPPELPEWERAANEVIPILH